MTPMLILIFGFDPKTAVGTDILHGAVFKSFGAVRHRLGFAFVLILSGIKLVGLPAATLVIEFGVACAALALVAWVAMQLRGRRLPVQDAA